MKKRYINNGLIVQVEDYITSINFTKNTMPEGYSKVRVYRNISESIINVQYNEGTTFADLPKSIMFKPVVDDLSTELTVEGKVIPEPTLIVNGVEYILSDAFYKSISVYRLHYLPELGITKNRIGIYKHNLYIGLVDNFYQNWDIDAYLDYINSSHVIYAHKLDANKFSISNMYSLEFNNKIFNYQDLGVMGIQREFYLNDTMVIADFIRQMRQRYPMINFYARVEDKDSTKYNEWVNYKIIPSNIKSDSYTFTSHVRGSQGYGRVWKTGINVEFEYASKDLPTLLARRDMFRVGKFFNLDQLFSYNINDTQGDQFDIQYTVFWERDNLDTEYQKTTSTDDTGYSMFTYKYTAHIGYTNLEDGFYNHDANVIESVIYTILYVPPKEDVKTYDEGYTLDDNDLNFKDFLLKYLDLTKDLNLIDPSLSFNESLTSLDISSSNYYENINDALVEMLLNIKSIKQRATKESNYVMVANLKQVHQLLQDYRINILSKIQTAKVDIVDEEPIGDNIETIVVDTRLVDPIELPTDDNTNNPIDDNPDEPVIEPDPEEPNTEPENGEGELEHYITTDGTYNDPVNPIPRTHKHYLGYPCKDDTESENDDDNTGVIL